MSVGSLLTEKRKKLGQDLPTMAKYLHIRIDYLRAIENDAFDELPPGDAYRIGFVKSYAKTLDLNIDEIIELYRREQDGIQKIPLRVRMPIRESSGSALGLAGLLIGLIAVVWLGWAYLHHSSDRALADAVAPVPDRLQPQAVATAVPASTSDAAEGDEARDDSGTPQATKAAPAKPATPAGIALSAGDGPSRVKVSVLADTWLQIRQGDKITYTGVLHAGDTYQIPDQPGWTMTAGNAAGVSLIVDGKPGPALGAVGAVIRDVPLTAK